MNWYGQVIVGLLTDEAVKSYKRTPIMNWESRFKIVSALSKVSQVIPQTTLDYTNNLRKIQPEYVVHGDDWKHVLKNMQDKKLSLHYLSGMAN